MKKYNIIKKTGFLLLSFIIVGGAAVFVNNGVPSTSAEMFIFGQGGDIEKTYGLTVQDLTGDLHKYFKLKEGKEGVLVTMIYKQSPAEDAGLEVGDIITSIEKNAVGSRDDFLESLLDNRRSKNSVLFTYIRSGKTGKTELILPEIDDDEFDYFPFHSRNSFAGKGHKAPFNYFFSDDFSGSPHYLGVMLQDLSPGMREYYNLSKNSGVLVNEVIEGTPAESAGLKSGDVIVEVDGHEVASAKEVKHEIVNLTSEEPFIIRILRKGTELELTAQLDKKPAQNLERFAIPHRTPLHKNGYMFHREMMPDLEETLKDLKVELDNLREEIQELKRELKD